MNHCHLLVQIFYIHRGTKKFLCPSIYFLWPDFKSIFIGWRKQNSWVELSKEVSKFSPPKRLESGIKMTKANISVRLQTTDSMPYWAGYLQSCSIVKASRSLQGPCWDFSVLPLRPRKQNALPEQGSLWPPVCYHCPTGCRWLEQQPSRAASSVDLTISEPQESAHDSYSPRLSETDTTASDTLLGPDRGYAPCTFLSNTEAAREQQ